MLFRPAAIAVSIVLISSASAQSLTPEEERIVAAVDADADAALSFLESVAGINSDTMNLEGVRETGDSFSAKFEEIGFDADWIDMAEVGRAGHLVARREGDNGNRILLIGHLDTVFSKDGDFQNVSRENGELIGPGVGDMKGGDVVVLYALKALNDAGLLDGAAVTVLFTGDEEKPGKPIDISRKHLVDAAKAADVALNFEGGEEGIAVTSRRGSSGWTLTTTGKRAHSSGIFSDDVGAGAVFEAARILDAFYKKLSKEKFLTFNPGVVVGGTDVAYDPSANNGSAFGKTNVVAQSVVVDGGLRFISEEQKARARAEMRKIVEKHYPETGATIEFEDSYPAMTPTDGNKALLAVFSSVSEDLGYGPVEGNDPSKRGAADVSFVAPHIAASMDGLGVRGSGAHTPAERMEIKSLKEATARTALLLYRLTREDAPKF